MLLGIHCTIFKGDAYMRPSQLRQIVFFPTFGARFQLTSNYFLIYDLDEEEDGRTATCSPDLIFLTYCVN